MASVMISTMDRWNPWKALADDPTLVVEWHAKFEALDGASWPGPPPCIMLKAGQTQIERRCHLTHEIVELETGGGALHPDPIVRRRGEHWIDRLAVDRLIPEDDFSAWLEAQEDPVTVDDVADYWRVTPEYATIALERRQRGMT